MSTAGQHAHLFAANEDAAAFYRGELLGPYGEGPRRYLIDRGFGALLDVTPWAIGHAPAGWTNLYTHLSGLGYSDDTLLEAGLVSRTRRGTLIDRFRDRITFGIRDSEARLCGFTARRSPNAPEPCPKYLNTPTTTIYRKSEQLFGLGDLASAFSDILVITEGPLDAIAVELGFREFEYGVQSVALCGSALTESHARLLSRRRNLILALDADEAGSRGWVHALPLLTREDHAVRVAAVAHGGDPADLFRAGGRSGICELYANSKSATQAIVDHCIDTWPTRGEGVEADICCLRNTSAALARLIHVDAAEAAARLYQRLPFDRETISLELIAAALSGPIERKRSGCTSSVHESPITSDDCRRQKAHGLPVRYP